MLFISIRSTSVTIVALALIVSTISIVIFIFITIILVCMFSLCIRVRMSKCAIILVINIIIVSITHLLFLCPEGFGVMTYGHCSKRLKSLPTHRPTRWLATKNLIIRIGFGGPLYYNKYKEPPE